MVGSTLSLPAGRCTRTGTAGSPGTTYSVLTTASDRVGLGERPTAEGRQPLGVDRRHLEPTEDRGQFGIDQRVHVEAADRPVLLRGIVHNDDNPPLRTADTTPPSTVKSTPDT